jgi:glutamyl-tRNA(Gln) amidotransferase subunit E
MYPETDIPDIVVSGRSVVEISKKVPADWSESVERLEREFSLSRDLALKLFDSDVTEEFERLARRLRLEPSFVASVMVDLPARLAREGVPESSLTTEFLAEALSAVAAGDVAKEAVPDVLSTAARRGIPLREAIAALGLGAVTSAQVEEVIRALLVRRSDLIREKKEGAFSPLMGEAMKELRGRADGAEVARVLRQRLQEAARKLDTTPS